MKLLYGRESYDKSYDQLLQAMPLCMEFEPTQEMETTIKIKRLYLILWKFLGKKKSNKKMIVFNIWYVMKNIKKS